MAKGQLRALAIANLRFWPTVAPSMWRSLSHWRDRAGTIPEPGLRRVAMEKLDAEAFNAEVAATLATLAPRPQREVAVDAIVALEVLFDYLDGRTEGLAGASDPVLEAERLFAAMTGAFGAAGAVEGGRTGVAEVRAVEGGGTGAAEDADGAYLSELAEQVRSRVAGLPSFAAMQPVALAALTRCAQAQSRLHAAELVGDEQLERWAREHCLQSDLEWREYAGGCASSVLAVHALIAAAARPGLTAAEADALDSAYLAIGALITMLDSTVDEAEDRALGQPGFIALFEPDERSERAAALARLALARCAAAPEGAHHAMTLTGVVAYYASHPGAGTPAASGVVAAVRGELGAAMGPTLAVMRTWRAAKAVRADVRRMAGKGAGGLETSGAEPHRTDVQ